MRTCHFNFNRGEEYEETVTLFKLSTDFAIGQDLTMHTPVVVGDIIQFIKRDLSPNHFMTLTAINVLCWYYFKEEIGTKELVDIGLTTPNSALIQSRLKIVKMQLEMILRSECVSACCVRKDCPNLVVGGGSYGIEHDPLYEISDQAISIWETLQIIPKSLWPPYAVPIIRRYLPLLKIYYDCDQNIDDSIENLESYLTNHSYEIINDD